MANIQINMPDSANNATPNPMYFYAGSTMTDYQPSKPKRLLMFGYAHGVLIWEDGHHYFKRFDEIYE